MEMCTDESAVLPSALATQPSSSAVAITTQGEVDGYREKAMRIASVEQGELSNIIELSITGHVLKWARQSNLFGDCRREKEIDGTCRIIVT